MPNQKKSSNTPVSKRAYVRRIETQMKKALNGFLEIGRILTEAKSNLDRRAWLDMINNDLPFTRRTAEKFIKIAADQRLAAPEVLNKLPPRWTSLLELTYLDDEQFEQGISSGAINPNAERKDITALRKPVETEPKTSALPSPKSSQNKLLDHRDAAKQSAQSREPLNAFLARQLTLAVVHQSSQLEEGQATEFASELEQLCRRFGLKPEFAAGINRQFLLQEAKHRLRQKRRELEEEAQNNPVDLLEDVFFQLETETKFALLDDGSFAPSDVRNPDNQFHDFDLEQLYGYCLDLQLLTKYTPIEYLDKQSFCDVQTIQILTGSPREREHAIANLEMLNAQFPPAKAMLEVLDG